MVILRRRAMGSLLLCFLVGLLCLCSVEGAERNPTKFTDKFTSDDFEQRYLRELRAKGKGKGKGGKKKAAKNNKKVEDDPCETQDLRECDEIKSLCGNGTVDECSFEECDFGDARNGQGDCPCDTNCQYKCGNGVDDEGEECDFNGQDPFNECGHDCKRKCGNGRYDKGEECDEGANNGMPNSSCDMFCRKKCGNGIIDMDSGEECDPNDPMNPFSSRICDRDCTLKCGNGHIDDGEECDDGKAMNGKVKSPCDANCRKKCGNGMRDTGAGEECDYRDESIDYWLCSTDCKWLCERDDDEPPMPPPDGVIQDNFDIYLLAATLSYQFYNDSTSQMAVAAMHDNSSTPMMFQAMDGNDIVNAAILVKKDDICIVAFQGYEDDEERLYESISSTEQSDVTSLDDNTKKCSVRQSFWQRYANPNFIGPQDSLEAAITACIMKNDTKKLVFTGHSIGASTAFIAGIRFEKYNASVIGFGTIPLFPTDATCDLLEDDQVVSFMNTEKNSEGMSGLAIRYDPIPNLRVVGNYLVSLVKAAGLALLAGLVTAVLSVGLLAAFIVPILGATALLFPTALSGLFLLFVASVFVSFPFGVFLSSSFTLFSAELRKKVAGKHKGGFLLLPPVAVNGIHTRYYETYEAIMIAESAIEELGVLDDDDEWIPSALMAHDMKNYLDKVKQWVNGTMASTDGFADGTPCNKNSNCKSMTCTDGNCTAASTI